MAKKKAALSEAQKIEVDMRKDIEPLIRKIVEGSASLERVLIAAHSYGFIRGRKYQIKKRGK